MLNLTLMTDWTRSRVNVIICLPVPALIARMEFQRLFTAKDLHRKLTIEGGNVEAIGEHL